MAGMKEENWIRNTNPIRAWLNETEETPKTLVIKGTIALGDEAENDEMRGTYWVAVRNMGKGCDTFPQSNIGKPSTLPQEVQDNVLSVRNRLVRAFAGIGEQDLIMKVMFPHGKTGGAYPSFDDWVNAQAKKGVDALVKGYRAKPEQRWNGEMVDDLPTLTPPPQKAKKAEADEVSEEE
tara:strand:- start:3227 stop:3763 length:537 start_codon:yes stop_codon:yes gene_type:complete